MVEREGGLFKLEFRDWEYLSCLWSFPPGFRGEVLPIVVVFRGVVNFIALSLGLRAFS